MRPAARWGQNLSSIQSVGKQLTRSRASPSSPSWAIARKLIPIVAIAHGRRHAKQPKGTIPRRRSSLKHLIQVRREMIAMQQIVTNRPRDDLLTRRYRMQKPFVLVVCGADSHETAEYAYVYMFACVVIILSSTYFKRH